MVSPKDELLNVLYIARCLGSMDDDFSKSELNILSKLTAAFKLSYKELKTLKNKESVTEALSQLESKGAKEILVNVMCLLAASDGDFDEKEQIFIKKVMGSLGLDYDANPFFSLENDAFVKVFSDVDEYIELIKDKALVLVSPDD